MGCAAFPDPPFAHTIQMDHGEPRSRTPSAFIEPEPKDRKRSVFCVVGFFGGWGWFGGWGVVWLGCVLLSFSFFSFCFFFFFFLDQNPILSFTHLL